MMKSPHSRGWPWDRRGAPLLAEHLCWTPYWDKQHGLWRVSQDDPDSSLHAASRDADVVIEYMAEHSCGRVLPINYPLRCS